MHNTFPSTKVQRLTTQDLTERFLPKHFHPQDLLQTLEEKEPSVSMGGPNNRFDVRLVSGTEQVVNSSSKRIRAMLETLQANNQLGPRVRVMEQLYREAGSNKLAEEIALYRIDGGAASIVRSLAMLRECGIEPAHSWTVMCLRTQGRIRDLIEVRQDLGVPEILLAGHLMRQKPNGEREGSASELIYTRDTFSLPTKVDQTHSVVDGRGFSPGTILWVGKKINTSTPVPLQRSHRKHSSEEAPFVDVEK